MRRYENCERFLSQFLGAGNDVDLLSLVDRDFVSRFAHYLFNETGGKYAQDTLLDVYSTLRTIARTAAKEGMIPAIDVFPEVLNECELELSVGSQPADSKHYSMSGASIGKDVERLLMRVSALERTNDLKYKRKSVLIYLIGLFLGGIEPEEVLDLRKQKKADDPSREYVIHPRLGVAVELSSEITGLAHAYNKGIAEGNYLIAIADDAGSEYVATRARKIKSDISEFLKESNIGLYASKSVFTDWLCCLHCNGVDDELIQLAVKSYLSNISDDKLQQFFNDGFFQYIDRKGLIVRKWYVLVSHASRLRGKDMKERIRKTEGLSIDVKRETYDPYDEYKVKIGGKISSRNNPSVSNLLFVKVGKKDAVSIDQMYGEASLLRRLDDRKEYATVPEQELRKLILFLKDFRDDVKIISNLDDIATENEELISPNTRVRVLNGPFTGYEGRVLRIKKQDAPDGREVFVIRVAEQYLMIEANLTRIEIEPIAT